tara:strand:+ start:464 stop:601 length:138 start_codon:yes stop_codon:yes gene_type:complete
MKTVKKKLPKTVLQFTFRNTLYKLGDSFRGTASETKNLIDKKYIR